MAKTSKGPVLPLKELFEQAGFTRCLSDATSIDLNNLQKLIKIKDEQDAINRFRWYNLPKGLTANLIERVLYFKGQGMFFKWGAKYYFLPYTLKSEGNTGIDCYGRYRYATPVALGSTEEENEKGKQEILVNNQAYKCIYDIMKIDESECEDCCVLLHDYSPGISQSILPRYMLQNEVIKAEAQTIPYMLTALINRTGVRGVRVPDETAVVDAMTLDKNIKVGAQTGKSLIPIMGRQDFQELSGGNNVGEPSVFMSAYQSLENFRKSVYGKKTDGMLQKSQHVLEGEHELNESSNDSQMNDALYLRQMFCLIADAVFGLDMWVDINPTIENDSQGYQEEKSINVNRGGSSDESNNENQN